MLGGARGAVLNIPERQSTSGCSSSPHPPLETTGSFSHLGGGGAKCGKCNKTVYKVATGYYCYLLVDNHSFFILTLR